MSIREVYAVPRIHDSYVELQMYAAGQNFVGGHSVTVYNASGALDRLPSRSPVPVANSQNQKTILVAASGYAATFSAGRSPISSMLHAAI